MFKALLTVPHKIISQINGRKGRSYTVSKIFEPEELVVGKVTVTCLLKAMVI